MNVPVKRGLIASSALLLFAAVYECFSHGVVSAFMVGAFLIPLLGECLPGLLLGRLSQERKPSEWSCWLWGAGLTVLTAGSLFRGVLEIYGTTSRLGAVYWAVGFALCLAAVLSYAPRLLQKKA